MRNYLTTTIGKGGNYNDWENVVGITTMIGIRIVVVGYNGWERASRYIGNRYNMD